MRMNHRLFGLLLFASSSSLISSGCVENRSSLFVYGNGAAEISGTTCEVKLGGEIDLITRGTFDLVRSEQYAVGYIARLVVGNQLQPLGDNDTLRAETSRIQLEGAEVSVTPVGSGSGGGSYTVSFTGIVDTKDSEEPGQSVIPVELIPFDFLTEVGEYDVTFNLFGHTLGGTEIESGEVTYTVEACRGCLSNCTDPSENEIAIGCSTASDYAQDCKDYPDGQPGECGSCWRG